MPTYLRCVVGRYLIVVSTSVKLMSHLHIHTPYVPFDYETLMMFARNKANYTHAHIALAYFVTAKKQPKSNHLMLWKR